MPARKQNTDCRHGLLATTSIFSSSRSIDAHLVERGDVGVDA
jgi:hypothetical protein